MNIKSQIPIISKLGGRRKVFEKLQTLGVSNFTIDAMRMWEDKARGLIPSKYIPAIINLAQKEGIEFTGNDFFHPSATGGSESHAE